MCGRYVRKRDKKKIAEEFDVTGSDLSKVAMPPCDYNVAPTTMQPVVRENREGSARELVMMRWGMIPYFSQSMEEWKTRSTFNARAETLSKTKTWQEPWKKRRCLVPASAFYEWKQQPFGEKREPYTFEMQNGSMFAFAGLWDAWKDPHGHWLQSFTIVTTAANALMAPIHERMPVILHERDYDRWLNRDASRMAPTDLLRPYEAEDMEMFEANPLVNNARNNGEELLRKP